VIEIVKTTLATMERVRKNLLAQKRVVEDIISKYKTSKKNDVITDYSVFKLFELHGIHYYRDMMYEGKFNRIVDGKEAPRMRICPEVHKEDLLSTEVEGRSEKCKTDCVFHSLCVNESREYVKILRKIRENYIVKKTKPPINLWNECLGWLVFFIKFIDKKTGEYK